MSSRLVKWARSRSLWVLLVNTGACNACDIEVLAALSPRYNAERFGASALARWAELLAQVLLLVAILVAVSHIFEESGAPWSPSTPTR